LNEPRIWLLQLRQDQGSTQEEVADKSGIQRAYYSQIELGIRSPSVRVSKSIAKVLKFKWTIFFDEECSVRRQTNSHPIKS